ncbi:MAG: class IV adenylate cyclase [Thermodesulfobacteriota bacterium]
MSLEVELKYPVADFASVRTALAGVGAERLGLVFERNDVFDSAGQGRLREAGILLRLRLTTPKRTEADQVEDRGGVLTLKLPPPPDAPRGFKVRREIETRVDDVQVLRDILIGLGYVVTLRYEKVRETWRIGRTVVCLDRLPFGRYVEIEGTPDAIRSLAERLGLSPASASTATYHDLHLENLDRLGLPHEDSFVFDTVTAARLAKSPSLDK